MSRKQKGFTLIELLIVVAIIGILAAIAIPNLLTAMARSRQKRSMADMHTIATAWESRATEVGSYSGAASGLTLTTFTLDKMDTYVAPTYIRLIPHKDGWDDNFVVSTNGTWGTPGANHYMIECYGRDGKADTNTVIGPTTNFDCDIVFSDGIFLIYPEGVQQQ